MDYNQVLDHFQGFRGNYPTFRAKCPGHASNSRSLSIKVKSDGSLLVHCFVGCETRTIMHSIGLNVRDLFPQKVGTRRDHEMVRRQFRRAPVATVEQMLKREIERQRIKRLEHYSYDTPYVRSADVNAARARVNTIMGTALAPVARYNWECCAPHDQDPLWPAALKRAEDELFFTSDRFAIEERAAQLLHDVGKAMAVSIKDAAA